jgi:methylated-DNA-[protein]-cysteine S-methyltransferase
MKKSSQQILYTALETPIGTLLVAASPRGVVRIDLHGREAPFLRELERSFGVTPVRDDRGLSEVRCALEDYFARRTTGFDVPTELGKMPEFNRSVLEELRQVPYGTVISYGELARRAGAPGAARAVGRVMGSNPLPIIYPCHRVLAQDGTLGGFGGGLPMKRALLELEGALLPLSGGDSERARPVASGRPRAQAKPHSRRKAERA